MVLITGRYALMFVCIFLLSVCCNSIMHSTSYNFWNHVLSYSFRNRHTPCNGSRMALNANFNHVLVWGGGMLTNNTYVSISLDQTRRVLLATGPVKARLEPVFLVVNTD